VSIVRTDTCVLVLYCIVCTCVVRLDAELGTKGTQAPRQTQPGTVAEGRGATRLASSRTGENPPDGMIRGGGGNEGRI
jgi:hypothetical protein